MILGVLRVRVGALSLGLALGLTALPAVAQRTPLFQSGGVIAPGDIAKIVSNGIAVDAGGVLGDTNGKGVNPFAIFDNNGQGVCSNTAATSTGYNALCIGHDASGNGLITLDSFGVANGVLNFRINGSTSQYPGTGTGNILGPISSTINDIMVWNNTAGTLARDGAGLAIAHTGDLSVSGNMSVGSAGTLTLPGAAPLTRGNQTPSAAGLMKIDNLMQTGSFPLQSEGSIWLQQTYSFFGIATEMTATTVPVIGAGNSPLTALFVMANDNASGGDVVAVLGDCVARVTGGKCWGGNLVARTAGGAMQAKLVGLEIDVQAAGVGDHVSDGCGLCINAFNDPIMVAPAIQIGSVSGGKFANGIAFDGVVGAALLASGGSAAMDYFIYTASGTYNIGAIMLGNQQAIGFLGASGTPGKIYVDASNAMRLVPGDGATAFAIRNNADNANLVTISSAGAVDAPIYRAGGTLGIAACTVVTAGATITIKAGLITAFTGC